MLFAAFLYLCVIVSVLLTDRLAPAPAPAPASQNELNVTEAYNDLQSISAIPHPYNSRANDNIRAYILQRLKQITKTAEFVEIEQDNTTINFRRDDSNFGAYFESTNVLVKIAGSSQKSSEKSSQGVLVSSHYDSVSTSYGAVDAGIGIVTLIQLIKYFTLHRPLNTVVFNLNNGEEDGFNGARAFMVHPWSNLTSAFLNLEGASSGGRPLLFRASSLGVVKAFKATSSPHATVLSRDAFNAGLVRSGTDYSVYNEHGGMQGLDFTFYRGRKWYHTPFDRVKYIVDGDKAIWAMLESSFSVLKTLANRQEDDDNRPAMYFDLFSRFLLAFPLDALFLANCAFLVLSFPALLFVSPRRRSLLNWRFPVSLVLAIAVQSIFIWAYMKLNPYVIASNPWLIFIQLSLLAYLTLTILTKGRNDALISIFTTTWLLTLLSTIGIKTHTIGGTYFIALWSVATWIGCLLGVLDDILVSHILNSPPMGTTEVARGRTETNNSETTPLLQVRGPQSRSPPSPSLFLQISLVFIRLLQITMSTLPPLIPLTQILIILHASLPETISDGSHPVGVFGMFAAVAILFASPSVPFASLSFTTKTPTERTGWKRWIGIACILALTTLYTLFIAEPFTERVPIKVSFQQTLTLSPSSSPSSSSSSAFREVKEETSLTGLPAYTPHLISYLPSSHRGKDVKCTPSSKPKGVDKCVWESGLVPPKDRVGLNLSVSLSSSPGSDQEGEERWGESVTLTWTTPPTKNCRVYFDGPISSYLFHSSQNLGWVNASGLSELRLWRRTFEEEFSLRFEPKRNGSVACQFSEWALTPSEGTVLFEKPDIEKRDYIPAFREVLSYLPSWGVVTKRDDGLVEVQRGFVVDGDAKNIRK